jgi:hypothetical protein
VGDRLGNVGVVPRRAGQPDLQVVGHRLDPVDPLGGAGGGELLGVGGGVAGQGHRAVGDGQADVVGLGDLGIPAQLLDHVVLELHVGLHD